MKLRENRIKHKLAAGGVATAVAGYLTADLVEFLGQLDFDGIWIEMEHGPVDFRDIPNYSRACDLWGKTSIVRVNLNQPGVIYRTLDLGAQAIVVPHVNTADEARAVVEASKFYPLGARGSYTSRQGIGVPDYQDRANDETMVIVLIEDIVAVDNLAEILTVDNVDVFFVAPGDLAQSMGHLGDIAHPDVVAAENRATDQIVEAGRVAGAMAWDANVEERIGRGARFLLSAWTPWFAAGGQAYLDGVSRLSEKLGVGGTA